MKKIHTPSRYRRSERGVALIFALGLLTLLSLLALSFVTGALLHQKTAANNLSYTQNRYLAQSALNNLLLNLQLYFNTMEDTAYGKFTGASFTGTVSREDNSTSRHDDRLTEWTDKGGDAEQPPLLSYRDPDSDYDLKETLTHPSLRAFLPDFDDPEALTASGLVWKPQWIYLKDSDGYLIGRYAYAVLPETLAFPLNLSWNGDVDQPRRLGHYTTELYFPALTVDSISLPAMTKQKQYLNYAHLYKKNSLATETDARKRAAVRKFYELYNPPDLEAFPYAGDTPVKWYHRFNLRREDWDSMTVDRLLGEDPKPVEFFDVNFTMQSNPNSLSDDEKNGSDAIPFLRRIGENGGGLKNLTTRRKQIAANIISFFARHTDKAIYPKAETSGEAEGGGTGDASSVPDDEYYFGNTLAPYLNEFGFQLKVIPTYQETPAADGSGNTTHQVTLSISLMVGAELVNFFGQEGSWKVSLKDISLPELKATLGGTTPTSQTHALNIPTNPLEITISSSKSSRFSSGEVEAIALDEFTLEVTLPTGEVPTFSVTMGGPDTMGGTEDVKISIGEVNLYKDTGTEPVDQVRKLEFPLSEQTIISNSVNDLPDKELLLGMQVDDPAVNLFQRGGEGDDNWYFGPPQILAEGEREPLQTPPSGETGDGTNTVDGRNQSLPEDTRWKQLEAWGDGLTPDATEFTAAVLSLIHRGAKNEWLNLTAAAPEFALPEKYDPDANLGDPGATWEQGDGALFDQIKMTSDATVPGKIDLNFRDDDPAKVYYGLFYNVPLESELTNSGAGTAVTEESQLQAISDKILDADGKFRSRAEAIEQLHGLLTDEGGFLDQYQLTELLGRTLPLTKAGELPTVIRAVVVAQGIREAYGVPDGFKIERRDPDGTAQEIELHRGQFDAVEVNPTKHTWVYGDEITGEIKLLVTLVRNPATGRFKVVEQEEIYE